MTRTWNAACLLACALAASTARAQGMLQHSSTTTDVAAPTTLAVSTGAPVTTTSAAPLAEFVTTTEEPTTFALTTIAESSPATAVPDFRLNTTSAAIVTTAPAITAKAKTTTTTTTVEPITLVFDKLDFDTTDLVDLEASIRTSLHASGATGYATMPMTFTRGSIIVTLFPFTAADAGAAKSGTETITTDVQGAFTTTSTTTTAADTITVAPATTAKPTTREATTAPASTVVHVHESSTTPAPIVAETMTTTEEPTTSALATIAESSPATTSAAIVTTAETTTTATMTTTTTTTTTTVTVEPITLVFDKLDFDTTDLVDLEASIRTSLHASGATGYATMPMTFTRGSIIVTLFPFTAADAGAAKSGTETITTDVQGAFTTTTITTTSAAPALVGSTSASATVEVPTISVTLDALDFTAMTDVEVASLKDEVIDVVLAASRGAFKKSDVLTVVFSERATEAVDGNAPASSTFAVVVFKEDMPVAQVEQAADTLNAKVAAKEPLAISVTVQGQQSEVTISQQAVASAVLMQATTALTATTTAARGSHLEAASDDGSDNGAAAVTAVVLTLVGVAALVVASIVYKYRPEVGGMDHVGTDEQRGAHITVDHFDAMAAKSVDEQVFTFSTSLRSGLGGRNTDIDTADMERGTIAPTPRARKFSADGDADACLQALHEVPEAVQMRRPTTHSNSSNESFAQQSSYRMSMNTQALRVNSIRRENPLYHFKGMKTDRLSAMAGPGGRTSILLETSGDASSPYVARMDTSTL